MLATFVDGVPTYEQWLNPKPEERSRAPAVKVHYRQPAAIPKIAAQPSLKILFTGDRSAIEKAAGYEQLVAAMPKDSVEAPDWVVALAQGIIRPVSSLTPGQSTLEEMSLDVALKGQMPVTFPHAPHTRWLACDNCHPDIFEMSAGAAELTMEKLGNGEYCGVCHGKVAFDLTACARCHPEMAG